jgi:starch-binding outer membrane protein, SusD/RagB family
MKIYIHRYTTLFTCSLALLMLVSCEDFLDREPQGLLTQEIFPTTADDALQATNAIYNILRRENFNMGLFPILDIMSDDAHKGSTPFDAAPTVGPYDNFTFTPSQDGLNRWWATLYEGVKRANVVIEKVPAITMDETLKNQYIAEARFLRGLFYFDLVRAWGGVPKVTGTIPPVQLPRVTAGDIYLLIEEDLLFAAANLPEKSELNTTQYGRATKGAARGYLAKVYLFQNKFDKAEQYALEVINSGQYALEADFDNANSITGEFGVESIFEVGAIGKEGLENGGNQYANVQGVRGTPNRGWGFNRPSLNLQNAFEPGDPRLQSTIIYLGEVLDGVTISGSGDTPDVTYASGSSTDIIEIECYNQKVWTPGQNVDTQHDHNRRLLRYADVLLMAAEALNENGKTAQALLYLNQVRARAREGNPGILPDITETNKDLLRDLILKERRVELALENHRFWDLVRTGKAAQVLGPLGFQAGKHELLPIPQTERDLAGEILEQNPNY